MNSEEKIRNLFVKSMLIFKKKVGINTRIVLQNNRVEATIGGVVYMTDTGSIHTQDERMRLVLNIVQRLFYDSEENSIPMADILREADIHEIDQKEAEETLGLLSKYGLINRLPNGKYTLN